MPLTRLAISFDSTIQVGIFVMLVSVFHCSLGKKHDRESRGACAVERMQMHTEADLNLIKIGT